MLEQACKWCQWLPRAHVGLPIVVVLAWPCTARRSRVGSGKSMLHKASAGLLSFGSCMLVDSCQLCLADSEALYCQSQCLKISGRSLLERAHWRMPICPVLSDWLALSITCLAVDPPERQPNCPLRMMSLVMLQTGFHRLAGCLMHLCHVMDASQPCFGCLQKHMYEL